MAIETLDRTIDTLLGGRVRIVQPSQGYRVAIDSVLVAAAVLAKPGETVLDVGAGTGAISFCLLARQRDLDVTSLEADGEHGAMLLQGIDLNGLTDRLEPVRGDISVPPPELKARQFDHVVTNPPYHAAGSNRRPRQPSRCTAGHETLTLADWLVACTRYVCSGGYLTLIHRADRLDAILAILAGSFGGVTVLPLWPSADAGSASRVIIVARRSSRAPARLCRGLVLHEADGRFTPAVERILRDAAALCVLSDGQE